MKTPPIPLLSLAPAHIARCTRGRPSGRRLLPPENPQKRQEKVDNIQIQHDRRRDIVLRRHAFEYLLFEPTEGRPRAKRSVSKSDKEKKGRRTWVSNTMYPQNKTAEMIAMTRSYQ